MTLPGPVSFVRKSPSPPKKPAENFLVNVMFRLTPGSGTDGKYGTSHSL